jgi:hypothetical protein
MDDVHAHGDDSPVNLVNLASRMTIEEAMAFLRHFDYTVDLGKHMIEIGSPVQIRYFHRSTRRYYRVTAKWSDIHEDPTRLWMQRLADLFAWATLEEADLSGRLLGSSRRVDGLQECDLGSSVEKERG